MIFTIFAIIAWFAGLLFKRADMTRSTGFCYALAITGGIAGFVSSMWHKDYVSGIATMVAALVGIGILLLQKWWKEGSRGDHDKLVMSLSLLGAAIGLVAVYIAQQWDIYFLLFCVPFLGPFVAFLGFLMKRKRRESGPTSRKY